MFLFSIEFIKYFVELAIILPTVLLWSSLILIFTMLSRSTLKGMAQHTVIICNRLLLKFLITAVTLAWSMCKFRSASFCFKYQLSMNITRGIRKFCVNLLPFISPPYLYLRFHIYFRFAVVLSLFYNTFRLNFL